MNRAQAEAFLEASPGFYGRLSSPERELVLRALSGQDAAGGPAPFHVLSDRIAGDFDYKAGDAGDVVIAPDARCIGFSCLAGPDGAQVTIGDGAAIPVPGGASFGTSIEGRLSDATIAFVGTVSYFVELVVG